MIEKIFIKSTIRLYAREIAHFILMETLCTILLDHLYL